MFPFITSVCTYAYMHPPSLYVFSHALMSPHANMFTCVATGLYKCPHKCKFCHVQWTLTVTIVQRVYGNFLIIIMFLIVTVNKSPEFSTWSIRGGRQVCVSVCVCEGVCTFMEIDIYCNKNQKSQQEPGRLPVAASQNVQVSGRQTNLPSIRLCFKVALTGHLCPCPGWSERLRFPVKRRK